MMEVIKLKVEVEENSNQAWVQNSNFDWVIDHYCSVLVPDWCENLTGLPICKISKVAIKQAWFAFPFKFISLFEDTGKITQR